MASDQGNPFDRIPPHDAEAEAGVLGSMLCDHRAADIAVELLVPGDFYEPRYKVLYGLFHDLCQHDPSLDELVVRSELEKRGLIERVGGKEVLGKLIESTPTAANIERYCRIVRERAVERELIAGAAQIVQMCQEAGGDDRGTLLERAEELVYRIADQRTTEEAATIRSVLEDIVREAERYIEAKRKGEDIPSPTIDTGFVELNKKFAGGFWPGEVIIIAARPSVGKTTLAINFARKIAMPLNLHMKRRPVAFFSMEMPKEQVAKNILCAHASTFFKELNSSKLRRMQFDEAEYQDIQEAARHLQEAPIFIDDSPGLTPGELRARARRLRHRENIEVIFVDYLQLMHSARRLDNREQEVAELSRQVKNIARELKVPIVLLSQLRRPPQGQENQPPKLTDLRESGAIEQDADVVIMLHRELDESHTYGKDCRVIVQKNRNGETGEARLNFYPHQFRFEDFAPGEEN